MDVGDGLCEMRGKAEELLALLAETTDLWRQSRGVSQCIKT